MEHLLYLRNWLELLVKTCPTLELDPPPIQIWYFFILFKPNLAKTTQFLGQVGTVTGVFGENMLQPRVGPTTDPNWYF